ncbi:MAG: aldehyde dehydrogenase, partial [Alcanivorax sp.]
MTKKYPYYLAGEAIYANTDLKVTDKYSGEIAYEVPLATPEVLDQAIAAAVEATDAMRKLTV